MSEKKPAWRKRDTALILAAAVWLATSCGPGKSAITEPSRTFPKNTPQDLNYENVSLLLEDMERFTKALKPLDLDAAQRINDRYAEVTFQTKQAPLFTNVYPDYANSRVVFLIFPKDPKTGSTYLLQYDKKLPVINESTVEIQIRTRNPEEPLTCLLNHPNPQAYIDEIRSHLFTVQLTLYKRFMQSGTYDFDGLTIATYRQRGYPFIVFDLMKSELTDNTAKLSCECR